MSDSFDVLFADLDQLVPYLEQASLSGLEQGATVLQATAQGTAAYRDVTGATRASTVAVVTHASRDGSDQVQTARSAAETRNPGSTATFQFSLLGKNPHVLLTVLTAYALQLETERAGAQAFLAPALTQEAPQLAQHAFQALAAALAGGRL